MLTKMAHDLDEALVHLLYILFASVFALVVTSLYIYVFVEGIAANWSFPDWVARDWVLYAVGHVVFGSFWGVLFIILARSIRRRIQP